MTSYAVRIEQTVLTRFFIVYANCKEEAIEKANEEFKKNKQQYLRSATTRTMVVLDDGKKLLSTIMEK